MSELTSRGHEVVVMYVSILNSHDSVPEAISYSDNVRREPPSPYDGLKLGSQLLLAEAGVYEVHFPKLLLTLLSSGKVSTRPIRWGESNDPGVYEARIMFAMPRFVKRLYAWYLRHIKRDETYAGLVENWSEKTVEEYLGLIAEREGYRERWFHKLHDEAFDFILTVPNALPATPHGGMKTGFKACGYTFLWNIVRRLVVTTA